MRTCLAIRLLPLQDGQGIARDVELMLMQGIVGRSVGNREVSMKLAAMAGTLVLIIGSYPGYGAPQVCAGLLDYQEIGFGQRTILVDLLHEYADDHALVLRRGIEERPGHSCLEGQQLV